MCLPSTILLQKAIPELEREKIALKLEGDALRIRLGLEPKYVRLGDSSLTPATESKS